MDNENNHINFTAADIEKYHKGLLSANQRHALEKAALEDPFLADAIEGYTLSGVNANADVAELKERLAKRVEQRKVIPINTPESGKPFNWLRVAATAVLIGGTALLVYQFAFNNQSKNIAQAQSKKKQEIKSADSGNIPHVETTNNEYKNDSPANADSKKGSEVVINNKTESGKISKQTLGAGSIKKDSAIDYHPAPTTSFSTAPKSSIEKSTQGYTTNSPDEKQAIVKEQATKDDKRKADESVTKQNDGLSKSNVTINEKQDNRFANIFRGRIIDVNNNPVPFANVTNTDDNVGTYSDAKGYFNLTSPDSVLDVRVRSIGFESNSTQLRNNVASNQVVLHDDRSNLSEVVISTKKPNAAARSQNANIRIEESEPSDGWENYDTYLANNLNTPDEIKTMKTKGHVEISFEVDKNGNPVNIKIEKSLCSKCDEEAIRLIKQGPKWKRKAKKGYTEVTVPF